MSIVVDGMVPCDSDYDGATVLPEDLWSLFVEWVVDSIGCSSAVEKAGSSPYNATETG